MLNALINAMKVKELRHKIFFTLGIIALYRVGSFIPVPGIPFADLVSNFRDTSTNAGLLMLNRGANLAQAKGLERLGLIGLVANRAFNLRQTQRLLCVSHY